MKRNLALQHSMISICYYESNVLYMIHEYFSYPTFEVEVAVP